MAKIILDDIQGGYNLAKINSNFEKLQEELNNRVLYRNPPSGEPNTLEMDIDANQKRIYNLPSPTTNFEAVTVDYLNNLIAALQELGSLASLARTNTHFFTAIGGETTITLPFDYVTGSDTTWVYKNGIKLVLTTDYQEATSTTITLTDAAIAGDEYEIVALGSVVGQRDNVFVSITPYSFTASGGETVITVPTYTIGVDNISVYLNGLRQIKGTDYTESSATTITLTSPLIAADVVHGDVGTVISNEATANILSYVNVKEAGALGDGIANDQPALQSAINTLVAAGGGTLYLPKGRYYVPNTARLVISGSINIVGDGMNESVLVYDDQVAAARKDFIVSQTTAPAVNVTFRDFGIEGSWGDGGVFTERSHLVSLNSVTGNVTVERCRFSKSHFMAMIINGAKRVRVSGCEFFRIRRDGCRPVSCQNVLVEGNYFKDVNDDAVAVHTQDSTSAPKDTQIIVTNNHIEDSQGIVCLGAKKTVISNNVLNRALTRAIRVGTDNSGAEGNTAALAISITGNIITDVIRGQAIDASYGNRGDWIYVSGRAPTVAPGLGFVGQGNGSGGIVAPFDYFYTNNTDSSAPHPGSWNIRISGNICMRTLKAATNYSDYGFGTRYSKVGPVDPAIALSDLRDKEQIIVEEHCQGLVITDNILFGSKGGIFLDGVSGSAYFSWKDVVINSNKISAFDSTGILVEGEGTASIQGNLIDGDPLHEHADRGANGTWGAGFANHSAIWINGCNSTIIGNEIRNVGQVFRGSATTVALWDNILSANPVSNTGYNASNVGIGAYNNPNDLGKFIIEDGDPASATYGQVLNICLNSSSALPASGKYIKGHFVRNNTPVELGSASSKYVIYGWIRLTTGSGHVLNTDWLEQRVLTGN